MLEIMDVPADVHVHAVLAQDGVYAALHVGAFGVGLWRVGEDGVVSGHYHPVLGGIGKLLLEPAQLGFHILARGIGV